MMKAGVPLVQALDIVGKGHDNASLQELILAIKADIEGGTSLTNALRKHPLYFDDLFCNLVEAGEQAGVLETLLDRIATYKEKTESMKNKDQEGVSLSSFCSCSRHHCYRHFVNLCRPNFC